MSSSTRLFSVAAANRLVPLLQATFDSIKRLRAEMRLHVEALRQMGYDFTDPEDDLDFSDDSEAQRRYQSCSDNQEEIVRSVTELMELGVEVKGLDGLVDVRSRYEDRVVYLCWKEGEETFSFWHELDAGFAGRNPIINPDLFEGMLLN